MLPLALIIEGLISSAPEAIALWQKIAPMVATKPGTSEEHLDEVTTLAPAAHAAVETLHQAVDVLVALRK